MRRHLHQALFVSQFRYLSRGAGWMRNQWYRLKGMHIGQGTFLPKIYANWPNQIHLGTYCKLEREVSFKYDGVWNSRKSIWIEDEVFIGNHCEFNISYGVRIGRFSNIASGCKFVDHDHGTLLGRRIGPQPSEGAPITLEEDVWLGCNVTILKGVRLGMGAVIAAGAVVTKSVPSNEIWGGVPARKIAQRQ